MSGDTIRYLRCRNIMFSESRWLALACVRHEGHISQVTGKCAARSGEIGGYPNSWHFYADLIYHFDWTEKPRKPDGPASAVSVVYILRTPESAPLRSGFLGLSPKSPKPARVRGKSHGWVTCILHFTFEIWSLTGRNLKIRPYHRQGNSLNFSFN